MIGKSGYRFSEKIMLKQKDRAGWRFEEKSSRSSLTRAPMPMFRGSAAAGLTAPARHAIGRHDFQSDDMARDRADAVSGDVPGSARRQPRGQGAGVQAVGAG